MSGGKDSRTYLAEIEAIQQTLEEQEGMQLLEPWAFFSWAAITIIGTAVSLLLRQARSGFDAPLILAVWLPAVAIGGGLELIGWYQVVRRKERVLRTDRMQRMQLSFIGMIAAFSVVGFGYALRGIDVSGLIVLLISVSFMAVAIFSWKELFIAAYLLLAGGIILIIASGLRPGGTVASYIAAAGLVAAAFIAGGIISSRKEAGSRVKADGKRCDE